MRIWTIKSSGSQRLRNFLNINIGEFKRGEAPLQKFLSPFPLARGRGIKGDRVIKTKG